jgi:hypothetical protein
MSMRKTLIAILMGMILPGFIWISVSAKKYSTKIETKRIEFSGEKHLTVKMDIGAGIIDLGRNRTGNILDAEVEYDPKDYKVSLDYSRSGEKGKLYLASESKHKDLDLDTEDNYWNLEFGDKIPINFEIDVGACEADFDFTGLLIDNLDMDLGASSVDVEFRKPNAERISEIRMDVGASKLTINGLGNANFDRLFFDGGVGDFTLDFSGDFSAKGGSAFGRKHKGKVEIDVGIGSLTIFLPKDAGVQIRSESSFLSSVSIDEDEFDEIEDDLYENDNFGKTGKELIFDIEVGMGSVKVEYVDSSL